MDEPNQPSPPSNSLPDAGKKDKSSHAESSSPSRHRLVIPFPLVLLLIFLFLGGLLLAGWYFQTRVQNTNTLVAEPSPSTMIAPQKELTIGTDPTLQPMEYTENGKIIGYDIDLANLLGKELGRRVVFKNIVFDNLFTALEHKDVDLIISAVTITPERQQKYDFSEQYLNAGQVIITRKDNNKITSTANLRGKRIATQKGTTNEISAIKYTSDSLVIRYPDFEQATKALVDGQVEALFTDLPSAKGITLTHPTLKIASDPFTNEYYGIVFRKGDPAVKQVNAALDSLRVKGFLTDLKNKWLD